jgi:hypothetical protein
MAADESLIDGYKIYWAISGTTAGLIDTKIKTGTSISVNLTGAAIPTDANQILVKSYKGTDESDSVTVIITDLSKYYIFVTTLGVNGNIAGLASYNNKDGNPITLTGANGIARADEVCNLDKLYTAHGLISPGIFKALLVGGTDRRACSTSLCGGGVSEQIDWVLTPGRTYIRSEQYGANDIATANSLGLFILNTTGPISLTNPITGTADNYWTGLDNDTTELLYTTSADTCTNWIEGVNGSIYGQYGQGNFSDIYALSEATGFGGNSCSISNRILCVEQ